MKVLFNSIGRSSHHQTVLFEMALAYARAFGNDQVAVVITDADAERYSDTTDRLELLVIPKKSGSIFSGSTDKRVSKQILSFEPEVVVTANPLGLTNELFFAGFSIEAQVRQAKPIKKKAEESLTKAIDKSAGIVVCSLKEQDFLSKIFPAAQQKIRLIYRLPASVSQPLTFEEKQATKEKYAAGNEFFLCGPADVPTTIGVLKGFSGFKKWQRSGMKLLLMAADQDLENALTEVLSSYRFKEDVSVIPATNEKYAEIVSAAYSVISPDAYDSDFSLVINTLSGGTAAMIPTDSVYAELIEEAAFNFKYNDSEDITRVFLEAFRDEKKRAEMIARSRERAKALQEQNFLRRLRQLFSSRV